MPTHGLNSNGKYVKLKDGKFAHEYVEGNRDEYMSTREVAVLLGVTRAAVQGWQHKQRERCPVPEPDGRFLVFKLDDRIGSWAWVWRIERKQEWLEWYVKYLGTRKQMHCPCCRYKNIPGVSPSDAPDADG